MCRILCFHSLTPARLPLLCCMCISLFHWSTHFNEKNIAVISLRRLKSRNRTWLQKSKSLGMFSDGKQLEQYRKVRCNGMRQEANRGAQPWKPRHRQGLLRWKVQNLSGMRRTAQPAPPACPCFPLASSPVSRSVITISGQVKRNCQSMRLSGLQRWASEALVNEDKHALPHTENVLFPSCPKPQITRSIISFKKFEFRLKSLTSQHMTAPHCHSFKQWINSFGK